MHGYLAGLDYDLIIYVGEHIDAPKVVSVIGKQSVSLYSLFAIKEYKYKK